MASLIKRGGGGSQCRLSGPGAGEADESRPPGGRPTADAIDRLTARCRVSPFGWRDRQVAGPYLRWTWRMIAVLI